MDKLTTILIVGGISLLVISVIAVAKAYLIFKKNEQLHSESKFFKWFNNHQSSVLLLFIIAFMFCVICSTLYFAKNFLPYPAATPETAIVPLFHATTLLTGLAFFITQSLLFYFAFKYRAKPERKAHYIKGLLKLELLWTAVPAVTFIALFLWGQVLWAKLIDFPTRDVLVVEVVAEQFNWRVRYPGVDKKLGRADFRLISERNSMGVDTSDISAKDDFIPAQMHVPKNKPVKLLLRSKDVIHSFFIPHFRIKMDALPGMITQMHFTPTITTEEMRQKLDNANFDYEIACAELCGRLHFGMKLILIVDEQEQFNRWYTSQKRWQLNNLAAEYTSP
jgi:cytochrome c oxidase subunit 2